MSVTNISFLLFKTHTVGLLQGSDCMRKYDPIPWGSSLNCRCTLLITSVHLLVLHSSPAWIESILQFHFSPEVGTVHQGKFWLAMERCVHCQGSWRVYKRMWRWCLYLFEVRHLKETGLRAELETKKKDTRMCRHVAKTHIYHDL